MRLAYYSTDRHNVEDVRDRAAPFGMVIEAREPRDGEDPELSALFDLDFLCLTPTETISFLYRLTTEQLTRPTAVHSWQGNDLQVQDLRDNGVIVSTCPEPAMFAALAEAIAGFEISHARRVGVPWF